MSMCRWCNQGHRRCRCEEEVKESPQEEQAEEVDRPSISEGYDSAAVKRAIRRGKLLLKDNL